MQVSLETNRGAGRAILRVSGDVVLDDAVELYGQLRRLAAKPEIDVVAIDFSGAGRLDSAGAVAARLGAESCERRGKPCALTELSEQHREALALVSVQRRAPLASPPQRGTGLIRRWFSEKVRDAASVAELVVDTTLFGLRCAIGRDPRRLRAIAQQTVLLGVDAWFIVSLLSFLIGVILAFQGAFQLAKFGASPYVAELVGLGVVREFAAIMTAIILAGRSGAAMAAELGTMSVHEEIDALKAMGIPAAQFLVLPRVAAISVAQPLLTLLSMAIGIGAGLSISGILGVPASGSLQRMRESLVLGDFGLGLLKSLLFAWIIGFVGCYMGVSTRGGARSVGTNTTRAVVLSIVLIVMTDSAVTTAWTLTHATSHL